MKRALQPRKSRPGRPRRRQPERTRHAILQAALVEFAQEGLAGARMDAIAEAARVNKALLYYYFRDKDALYGAVLDGFFAPLHDRVLAVCDQPGTAGERFLAYARVHFDSIAESPHYARIFMGELMSAGRGGSTHLDRLAQKYMMPIGLKVLGLVNEGVSSGEFRSVDPSQFIPSAIGAIVHYFLTAPLRQKFAHVTPFAEQSIGARRAAVLDFIAAALFADRDAGTALAARIAQATQPPADDPSLHLPTRETRPTSGRRIAVEGPESRTPPTPPALAPAEASAPTPPPLAPTEAHAPTPPSTETPAPTAGYSWMNRWFPDAETAAEVLRQEAKRSPRSARARRPPNSDRGGSQ